MKKLLSPFITVFLTVFFFSSLEAQSPMGFDFDPCLLGWVKSNVSPITQLPYSFYIPKEAKARIYQDMDSKGAINGSIERTITKEGLDIYDGAVYQIVLSMAGGEKNLEQAFVPINYYWQGAVGNLATIRAGYPVNLFVYDVNHPEAVSSDNDSLGQRGFIFRIINADGEFLVSDPKDGNTTLAGFPEQDRLHWVDWKPVAGENAWVVMAAMQLYHKKYCNSDRGGCLYKTDSIELRLAEELARAAIILQSDSGGIRMAPLGTYRSLEQQEKKYFTEDNWWYNHISTENNISWYAALRMLFQVTGKAEYKKAMEGIERYMRFVWDDPQGFFYQGAYEINGQWKIAGENFALDVQTWSLDCFGPKRLDAWLGDGSAWRIWQTAKKRSGVYDPQGQMLGVGYTDEHDRVSVEWSAGALVALQELGEYYFETNPDLSQEAFRDKLSMRRSIENLRFQVSQAQAAYSYSSRRGWIPFGWNSHDPQVMSLASTGWMMFVDAGVNPFWFITG
ncbi:MAG: hypothetical protein HQL14_01825 [Candidatus Omnitrophica bacterium]|nr:hypothetical protein [Candidatus Omnitrophota bacterium]